MKYDGVSPSSTYLGRSSRCCICEWMTMVRLNDIVYTDYHKFGAEGRMLPGFDVVPDAAASR